MNSLTTTAVNVVYSMNLFCFEHNFIKKNKDSRMISFYYGKNFNKIYLVLNLPDFEHEIVNKILSEKWDKFLRYFLEFMFLNWPGAMDLCGYGNFIVTLKDYNQPFSDENIDRYLKF